MIKTSYEIARLFGIPIRLDISLIILMFLLISGGGDPFYSLAAGGVLLISITLHELGHSLAAMAFGCRVRDITLMMMGGCATLLNMPRKAWQEFLVAVAGPAVSLLLALAGLFLPNARFHDGNFYFGTIFDKFIFFQVGFLNAILFLFNLLPAFPMDGGRILRAFLQQFFMSRVKATWVASRIGRVVAVLMALSVVYSLFSGRASGYLLIRLVIAYYIYRTAEREYQQVLLESRHDAAFGSSDDPPDAGVVISPPPYRSGREWTDVHRL